MRTPDYKEWQEGCAHDPSMVEWNGAYYVFSTDTFGAPSGYQIRKSTDLLHFEYIGSAFRFEGKNSEYKKGKGEFQPAFDWCVTDQKEVGYGICTRKDGSMSFWAPHCVPGSDGKFWLYFCLTGYFGGSKSCIGLAKADTPEDEFHFVGLIVCSPAGWRTPNCIDPQFFHGADGRDFLVYGSYGLGLFVLELDPKTGLRKDGYTYDDLKSKKITFRDYYGENIARGSMEGGVIHYKEGVDVLEGDTWVKKNYYYLMCSYGSLSSVYNIRCGRSENPTGPYVDVNGNELVCSTDIGTGNKMLGSFRWLGAPVDFYCPGHNDIFTTSDGVELICYHCRTNYFLEKKLSRSNNFHYVYLSQYAYNSDGWPVMNANRYALEELQPVSSEELLNITAGKFEIVMFTQGAEHTVNAKLVKFSKDGTITGAYTGSWKTYGKNYISITIGDEEYLGVIMPAWIDDRNVAGLTITAMGRTTGMGLHLNSSYKIG